MVVINDKQEKCLKKHNAAIRSYSDLSLLERKIANALLYNAYPNLTYQNIHTISISRLLEILSLKTNDYHKLKQAIKQLMSTIIEWNVSQKEKDRGEITNEFKTVKPRLFDSKENWKACTFLASVQINRTLIKYEYSELLRKLLYQPSLYSKISLSVQSKFRSVYSFCLYENSLSYLNCGTTGWIDFSSFRKLMGVKESKYKIFRDFNKRVLKLAIQEVNKLSDIDVNYQIKKENKEILAIKLIINRKEGYLNFLPPQRQVLLNKPSEDLIKTLDSYGVSKTSITSWIKEYGEEYIKTKIDLIKDSTIKIKNPAAFLNKAMKEDWNNPNQRNKEEKLQLVQGTKPKISIQESQEWFKTLPDKEKTIYFEQVLTKFPIFEVHMKDQALNYLDANFTQSSLFVIFMQVLNQ